MPFPAIEALPAMDSSPSSPNHHILSTDKEATAILWHLVLSAVNIPHRIDLADTTSNHTWQLWVAPHHELRATHELECYFIENKDWPPAPPTPNHDFVPLLQPPTLLLMGALLLFYSVTGTWEDHSFWFALGAGSSERILQHHEWWRLLTALTLHADAVHLLSNCLIGGWLVHFLCRLTGTGLGLFSLLLTAAGGNLINVLMRSTDHRFVGFSTAVFAVIGILAVLSYQGRGKITGSHFLIPFMAGAALLAALGSSGERTDLGAHLFGLLCGLANGQVLAREPLHSLRHSLLLQSLCFLLFLTLLVGSWWLALHAPLP